MASAIIRLEPSGKCLTWHQTLLLQTIYWTRGMSLYGFCCNCTVQQNDSRDMDRSRSGFSSQTNRINAWSSSRCHCSKWRIHKILTTPIGDKQMQMLMSEFESNHCSIRWVIQKLSGSTVNNFVVIPALTHLPRMWLYKRSSFSTISYTILMSIPSNVIEKFWIWDI